jgi:hypothetical protein
MESVSNFLDFGSVYFSQAISISIFIANKFWLWHRAKTTTGVDEVCYKKKIKNFNKILVILLLVVLLHRVI